MRSGETGKTLVEAMAAAAIAVVLGWIALEGAIVSLMCGRAAQARSHAGQDVRRALGELERALRATRRDPEFAVRSGAGMGSPRAPGGTAGSSIYLPQLTGIDPATRSPIYAGRVSFSVEADAKGSLALFAAQYDGEFSGAPRLRVKLATGIATATPFLDTGGAVVVSLGVRRGGYGRDEVGAASVLEVAVAGDGSGGGGP